MADEKPVVEAPVVVPIAEVTAPVEAPAVVDAPVVLDAHATPTLLETIVAPGKEPVVEAAPADPVKPEGGDQPTDKPEAKPVEVKPAEEKPAEVKADAPVPEPVKPAEVVLAPVEYKYELPETIKLDDTTRGEFHSALDEFRKDPNVGSQKLINMYNDQMTKYDAQLRQEQHAAFIKTKSTWENEIKSDPELGGAGYDTASKAVARMRDRFVSRHAPGTPEYQSDFNSFDGFLRATGAGSHPAMWRYLHNLAWFMDEPTVPSAEINPAPNNGKSPQGGRVLYDNPRSTRQN